MTLVRLRPARYPGPGVARCHPNSRRRRRSATPWRLTAVLPMRRRRPAAHPRARRRCASSGAARCSSCRGPSVRPDIARLKTDRLPRSGSHAPGRPPGAGGGWPGTGQGGSAGGGGRAGRGVRRRARGGDRPAAVLRAWATGRTWSFVVGGWARRWPQHAGAGAHGFALVRLGRCRRGREGARDHRHLRPEQ